MAREKERERERQRKKKSLCNCAGTFGNSNDERQSAGPHFPFLHRAGLGARHHTGAVLPGEPEANMDQEAVGNIVLLAIVTLISVVQNGKRRSSLGSGGGGGGGMGGQGWILFASCWKVRLTPVCVSVRTLPHFCLLLLFVSFSLNVAGVCIFACIRGFPSPGIPFTLMVVTNHVCRARATA